MYGHLNGTVTTTSPDVCGTDDQYDPTVINYKYICDGLLVSIIGSLGLLGNLISCLVLTKPKLRDCFHQGSSININLFKVL